MSKYSTFHDAELVNLLTENDKDAFSEIYTRYWKKLFAVAYNRISVESICEDVLHDVFTDLWIKRKAKSIDNLNAYLATAVKYSIFNHIRKVSRIENLEDFPNLKVPSREPAIDQLVDQRMVLERLSEEVDRLPVKCRVIFKYSREEYLNNNEIADKLGISIRTVENQLTNAKRRLKEHVQQFLLFGGVFFTIIFFL